ncbi:MAG: S8 family serine peptidase [Nocardioidaceae bacterium]
MAATASTASSSPQGPAASDDKIRPKLLDQLESKDSVDFWIYFEAKADLSKAGSIGDWDERGTAVARELRQTAESSQAAVQRDLDRAGIKYQAFWVTNAIKVSDGDLQLAEQVASRSEVDSLWASFKVEVPETTKGENVHQINAVEWGIANINADDVWNQYGVRGEGITVASIDTGVQYDHPALVGKYRGNNGDGTFDHNYNWFDAAGSCSDAPCDNNGHGSHTMGTMAGDDGAGNQIGVAPGVTWIAANGCCPSDAALIASGEWMLAPTDQAGENADPTKRPHIVNNSWGTTVPSNDPFMEDVLEAWNASGIFGAWSNGNSGPACQTSGAPGSRIVTYSAGAYDINNNIAGFSARGPGQDGEIKPNLAAPGVNVRSSVPGNGYANFSGTSMAAPHMAGTVALLWSAAPALVGDVAGTRSLLDDTAVDTEALQCGGTTDDNSVFGEGRLDALALLGEAPVGDTGTLEGTVTDAGTGEPIDGAQVSITGPVERELETGDDGTFSLRVTAGDYTVAASSFGYAGQSRNVTVAAGETVTADFALQTVPSVVVSGQVTDGSGHGWPLYAKVTVQGTDGATYTRPYNGRYQISLPVGATYTLTVDPQYDGYETVSEDVVVGDSNMTHDVAVPVDNSQCLTAPGYEYNYDGIVESFDAGQLPAGWTIEDNVGNGQVWRFDDPDNRGNLTGGEGTFAIADSDFYGSGQNQDTSLVSPVIDISAQESPIIGFKQDYNNLGDVADVDLSVDGGATWETVLHQTGDVRGPDEQAIAIPQAAGEPDVQVRFHYYEADFDWWWQVDDVFVGNRTCDPVAGGIVLGHVRDDNTSEGVNGATVTSVDAPGQSATSAATPDDEAIPDGFYWMFSSLTGDHAFTASAGSYQAQEQSVSVEADWATRADYRLAAGMLTVAPDEVSGTMRLGPRTREQTFTVTNDGGAPAELEFAERDGEFEMLRADGTRMTQREIAESEGTKEQRIDAPVSFAAKPTSSMNTNQKTPAAGPSEAPWTDIADYPANVMDNRVVTLDGSVYSIAGGNGTASTGASWVYNPATLAWEPIADVPAARNAMTVGAVDGRIVASGGWGASGPAADTWVYDPASNSWSEAADNPAPRAAAGQAMVDGKLFAVGGCTTSACTPMGNDVVSYDLASDSWQTHADYPASVAFASCAGIGGKLYCTGGNAGTGGTADGYVYDPGSDTWTAIADAPADTWASAYSAANGQLLVNGGVQGGAVTNAGFAYDPGTDTWSDLPNSNTARYRGAAGCGFYKVGGSSGGFTATTDSEVLPGFAECAAGGGDVEWLSIDTTSATLQPGDSVTVTVTMSADVDQPGTYTGGVGIAEDTPYAVAPVGVTMNVTPPVRWGKIAGTVTGVSCDGSAAPLPAATVQLDSWASDWTFSTGPDGTYAYWIDQRNNPLTAIAAKDGYKPKVKQVKVVSGQTVRADFALQKAGC